jgi:hypothetical protein
LRVVVRNHDCNPRGAGNKSIFYAWIRFMGQDERRLNASRCACPGQAARDARISRSVVRYGAGRACDDRRIGNSEPLTIIPGSDFA